ncbi:MAG TPA: DUF4410 domain-containing protein [Terriglobales bacterium]|jgi:hypothetical protein|nr:DUF4410 domain-containing protein [Terriglobales bacterium]
MRKYSLVMAVLLLMATWAVAKDEPKFKSIEVKHFPNAEGVELPPEFSDYLYAELRATLQKKKLADQLLGEDEVVDPADAPKSAILEGSVLEYKKGSVVKESLIGFGAGGRSLTAHIKVTRRSNNEIIVEKDIKVRAMARWDPKTLAKFLANSIAGQLKHSD